MVTLKLKNAIFLFVLLEVCLLLCSCQTPAPAPAPGPAAPPSYDYLALVLTWPNAFCKDPDATKYSKCNPSKPKQHFTIHGLWPSRYNNGETPIDCDPNDTSLTDDILIKLETDLKKYWPNLRNADSFEDGSTLWRREWKKHGTCSKQLFSAEEYLKKALEYTEKYAQKIFDQMNKKDIKPDGKKQYNSLDVRNAIKSATGRKAFLACKDDKEGKRQLYEIRLCITKDGTKLEDCDLPGSGCRDGFIFASPPTSIQHPFLSSVSSTWENLVEAAGL